MKILRHGIYAVPPPLLKEAFEAATIHSKLQTPNSKLHTKKRVFL